jgi:hypothetical protein
MPLTPLQELVISTIRANRHPGSHVAGNLPLHAGPGTARVSHGIDHFHDAMNAMHAASAADSSVLENAGLRIRRKREWTADDTFRSVEAWTDADADDRLGIDWAVDSAWRFYPPVTDPTMGWRLHDVDLACDKALALAARSESRDLIDIIEWGR